MPSLQATESSDRVKSIGNRRNDNENKEESLSGSGETNKETAEENKEAQSRKRRRGRRGDRRRGRKPSSESRKTKVADGNEETSGTNGDISAGSTSNKKPDITRNLKVQKCPEQTPPKPKRKAPP